MNIPGNLRYTKDHEWALLEGGQATIGISHHAVEQLGDITLVEAPAPGTVIAAGDAVGTIESVKAVSDLYAPLSGTVTAVNDTLEDAPETVNNDCYGGGWMFKLKLSAPAEAEALLDAAGYEKHLESLDE